MKNSKREKITGICYLIASCCFYVAAIMSFIDNNTYPAIMELILGSTFLCLFGTNIRKNKDGDGKDE